jgi:hypothetical protein
MKRIVVLVLAAGLLSAACSSGGGSQKTSNGSAASRPAPSATGSAKQALVPQPIKGCVPRCNPPGLSRPGPILVPAYKTEWFFGSQLVISPSEYWSIHEDSTGEFALTRDASPADSVLFWEDVYPTVQGKRVIGVPMTVKGFLGWLQQSSQLDVSTPHAGKIGSDLPATVVDVSIAKGAKNEDPDCPAHVCVEWVSYPQWDGAFGIAQPQVQRLYLSDVTYGASRHLFVAVIYPDDPRDMGTFAPKAEKLMQAVQVPASAA